MTEREYAIEVLTERYHEQCERWPRTREISLKTYLRVNVPTLIANWHAMAAWPNWRQETGAR